MMADGLQSSSKDKVPQNSCSDGPGMAVNHEMVGEEQVCEDGMNATKSCSISSISCETSVTSSAVSSHSTDNVVNGCDTFSDVDLDASKSASSSSVVICSSTETVSAAGCVSSPQQDDLDDEPADHNGSVSKETDAESHSSSVCKPQMVAADSFDKVQEEETDHSDSDIISLSEEDISTEAASGFVITNVCSLREKYQEETSSQSSVTEAPDTPVHQSHADVVSNLNIINNSPSDSSSSAGEAKNPEIKAEHDGNSNETQATTSSVSVTSSSVPQPATAHLTHPTLSFPENASEPRPPLMTAAVSGAKSGEKHKEQSNAVIPTDAGSSVKQPNSQSVPTTISLSTSSKYRQLNQGKKSAASQWIAIEPRKVATSVPSSIVLALPKLLPKGALQPATPVKSPGSQTVLISASASSKERPGANSKEFNDKVLTRLHGLQGQPGSQQLLKIPMADGSTHTVKVIFAPQVQPSTLSSPGTQAASVTVSSPSGMMSSIGNGIVSSSTSQLQSKASTSQNSVARGSVSTSIVTKKTTEPRKQTPSQLKIVRASPGNVPSKSFDLKELVVSGGELSVSDMASLIQGQNQEGTYFPPCENLVLKASTPLFRCVECGDTFCTVLGYSAHTTRMSMVIRYACIKCQIALVFFNRCTFLAHLRLHASVAQLTGAAFNLKSCTMCVSSLPDILLPHTGEHHMDPMIHNHHIAVDCTECDATLPNVKELAKHFGCEMAQCLFEYTCPHCKMELPTACSLKAHLRLHADDHTIKAQSPYVCPECGLCFPNQSSLYQHIHATCLHFNRFVPLYCKVCSFMALSREVLQFHLTSRHMREKMMFCLICRAWACWNEASFKTHLSRVHNVSASCQTHSLYSRVSACVMCHQRSKNHAEHMLTHVKEAASAAEFAFACTLCESPFVTPSRKLLVQHLTSHHGAYRFRCAICRLGFVSVSALRLHVLSDHIRSIVHCGTCRQSISEPEAVLPHVMWHVVKNIQDGITVKLTKSTLMDIRAMLVQSKVSESQFCRVCGQMFVSFSLLQQHLKNHRIWGKTLCCVCQRFDFVSNAHEAACLAQLKASRHDAQGSSLAEDVDGYTQLSAPSQKACKGEKSLKAGSSGAAVGTKRSLSSVLGRGGPSPKKAATGLLNKNRSPAAVKVLIQKLPAGRQSMSRSGSVQALGAEQRRIPTGMKRKTAHCDDSSEASDEEREASELAYLSQFPPFVQGHASAAESPSVRYHPCHLCGLTYESKETLMSHYANVHSGRKNVYVCLACRKLGKERSFNRKQLLVTHCLRKHRLTAKEAEGVIRKEAVQPKIQETGEVYPTPQAVNSPQPSTPDKSPVKRLRVAGSTEQEFVCAKCMFSASSQAEFHAHITEHKVDNSVQCLECGLCFSVIPALKKHLFMVHRIQKPQAYIEENKITLQDLPDELVSHMNTLPPLGDQEFVINVNRTTFFSEETSTSPVIKKELQEQTEASKQSGSLLECTVCYREFQDEAQLKSHMRTHGMAFIRSRRSNARDSNARDSATRDSTSKDSTARDLTTKDSTARDSTAEDSTTRDSYTRDSTTRDSTARVSTTRDSTARDSTAKDSTTRDSTARDSTAKDSTARDSTAKDSTARDSTARVSTTRDSTARDSTAKDSTARVSTTRDSTARDSTAKDSTARVSTTRDSTARVSTAKDSTARVSASAKEGVSTRGSKDRHDSEPDRKN